MTAPAIIQCGAATKSLHKKRSARGWMETERVVTAAPLDALVVEPSAQLEVDGAPAELGVVARALEDGAHLG